MAERPIRIVGIQIVVSPLSYGGSSGTKDAAILLDGSKRYRLHHVQINNDLTTDLEVAQIFLVKTTVADPSDGQLVKGIQIPLAAGRATLSDGLHMERAVDVDGPCAIVGRVNHEAAAITHYIVILVEELK